MGDFAEKEKERRREDQRTKVDPHSREGHGNKPGTKNYDNRTGKGASVAGAIRRR